MGKWHKEDRLQSYLDGLKDKQDHQYSKRMSFYRIKPEGYYKLSKENAWYLFVMFMYLILVGVFMVLAYLASLRNGFSFAPGKGVFVVIFGLGLLYYLAGMKALGKKKGRRKRGKQ